MCARVSALSCACVVVCVGGDWECERVCVCCGVCVLWRECVRARVTTCAYDVVCGAVRCVCVRVHALSFARAPARACVCE